MAREDAEQLVKDLAGLSLQILPVAASYELALQIGLKYQLAIYDSIYVALASSFHYPLITVDQAQERAATSEGVTIIPVTHFTA